MRYAKGHKDTSHERIVTIAAKNFRRLGIAAAGMTGIMAEAGLTNGGFYSHFRSKSDLVREGLERALDEQLQSLSEADVVPGELNQRIRLPCPRSIATGRTLDVPSAVSQNRTIPVSQDSAIGVYAVLVGALQLARAVDDHSMFNDILAAGIRAATTLAGHEE
jgi:TetR/AcrR family transcriptional repressor of nem operon